jgi:hypothetical protein
MEPKRKPPSKRDWVVGVCEASLKDGRSTDEMYESSHQIFYYIYVNVKVIARSESNFVVATVLYGIVLYCRTVFHVHC